MCSACLSANRTCSDRHLLDQKTEPRDRSGNISVYVLCVGLAGTGSGTQTKIRAFYMNRHQSNHISQICKLTLRRTITLSLDQFLCKIKCRRFREHAASDYIVRWHNNDLIWQAIPFIRRWPNGMKNSLHSMRCIWMSENEFGHSLTRHDHEAKGASCVFFSSRWCIWTIWFRMKDPVAFFFCKTFLSIYNHNFIINALKKENEKKKKRQL